jgi:DNA modification methylase
MPQRSKSVVPVPGSNFAAIQLQIEQVPTERLGFATRQVKTHSKSYIAKLAAGIGRVGFLVPMLVDEHYGVVSGHARLAAARELKLAQVPVVRIEHLTPEQLRVFALFENKIVSESEFDEAALNLEFEELRLSSPELNLTDSGFAIGEIDALAGRVQSAKLDDLDRVIERDPKGPAVSQPSDIWLCGRHRLICGDATDAEVIEELVDGAVIHQLITDPPYNLPTRAFSSTGIHGDFGQARGELDEAQFTAFLASFLEVAKPHMADGALIYAYMDAKHISELLAAGRGVGLDYKALLVWVKSGSGGQGSFYRSGHELVAIFKHGKGAYRNNIQLGRFGRNRSNVLQYPGITATAGGKRALKLHPTVKNVAMIADLMLDASAPGDNILDCFGGSGTTLIAAEKTDRTAFLCELSPAYVDVIVERFDTLGSEPARLASTGQTLAEVRAERLPTSGDGEAT